MLESLIANAMELVTPVGLVISAGSSTKELVVFQRAARLPPVESARPTYPAATPLEFRPKITEWYLPSALRP